MCIQFFLINGTIGLLVLNYKTQMLVYGMVARSHNHQHIEVKMKLINFMITLSILLISLCGLIVILSGGEPVFSGHVNQILNVEYEQLNRLMLLILGCLIALNGLIYLIFNQDDIFPEHIINGSIHSKKLGDQKPKNAKCMIYANSSISTKRL